MSAAAVRAGESARAGAPDMSPLQRHVSYFDPAGTGKVRWGQTYRGLRDLGVGRFWSAVLTTIIHAALGRVTGGGWLTIDIANIQRGKHDSDTGVFDERGELVLSRFDALFESAAGSSAPDRLSFMELRAFQKRGPQSAAGNFFSWAEAKLFFCVAADTTKREDGGDVPAIRRKTLRTFYDGNLLPRIARLRRLRAERAVRPREAR